MHRVKIECPKCQNLMSAPSHLAGFVLECTKCTEKFYFVPENLEELLKKKNINKNNIKPLTKSPKSSDLAETVDKKDSLDKKDADALERTEEPSVETKKEEQLQNILTQRNEGLFLSVTSIFSALLICVSLFLPAIIVAKDKYLSFFSSAFDIQQLGVVLSVISPERFLFFLIILIPLLSIVSIIIDLKNIVKKRIGIIFYRLLLLSVTFGYFALAFVLMSGGGLNFESDSYFKNLVTEASETDGIAGVFNSVFGPGVWFLLGGVFIILIVTLFDLKKLLKRKKIEG